MNRGEIWLVGLEMASRNAVQGSFQCTDANRQTNLAYRLKKRTASPGFADDNDVTDGYGRACPCRSGHARILLIPIRRAGHDRLRAAESRHSDHFALISEPEIGGILRMDSVATT
jgi:hypothetical protein